MRMLDRQSVVDAVTQMADESAAFSQMVATNTKLAAERDAAYQRAERAERVAVKQGAELDELKEKLEERCQTVKHFQAESDSLKEQLAVLTALQADGDELDGLIQQFHKHAFSAANWLLAQSPDRNPLSALMIRIAELLQKLKADLADRDQKILGLTRDVAGRDRQIADLGGQHFRDLDTIKRLEVQIEEMKPEPVDGPVNSLLCLSEEMPPNTKMLIKIIRGQVDITPDLTTYGP